MRHCPVLAAPQVPPLARDEVHVWRCLQDDAADELPHLLQFLSGQERARALRFRFEEHRTRFIVRRGMLRVLLGRYLDCDPAGLELREGVNGKPAAVPPPGRPAIHFNVSHSAGLALIAVGLFPGLGVDVEQVRALSGCDGIAVRFFPAAELEAFRSLPPHERQEGFFRCWTRTEAYVKGLGAGVALLERRVGKGAAAAERSGWSLHSFSPAEGYTAALAVPGRSVVIRQFSWPVSSAGHRGSAQHGTGGTTT